MYFVFEESADIPDFSEEELLDGPKDAEHSKDEKKVRDSTHIYLKEMGRVPMFSRKRCEEEAAGRRLILARQKLLNSLLKFKPSANKKCLKVRKIFKSAISENVDRNKRHRRDRLASIEGIWEFLAQFQNEYRRWPDTAEIKEYFSQHSNSTLSTISSLRLEDLKEEAKLRTLLDKEPSLKQKSQTELLRKKFPNLNYQIFLRVLHESRHKNIWEYWRARIFEDLQDIPVIPVSLSLPLDALLDIEKEFVKANLRLAVLNAKKYAGMCFGSKLEFNDLIQEANIGLYRAARRFSPEKGFRFSTFATWWIRQYIQRALDNCSNTIRVPVHVIEKYKKIKALSIKMSQELGREPTAEEIVERFESPFFKLTANKVRNILDIAKGVDSLDRERSGGAGEHGGTLGDFIEDTGTKSPEEIMLAKDLEDKVDDLFSEALTPREIEIMNLRFGRKDYSKEYTLEEVGAKLFLTPERIRQIENGAIRKLRHPKRKRILEQFLAVK